MAFQGELGNINLGSVFQNLSQNRLTGTLRLRNGKLVRHIYFRDGQINMFSEGEDSRTPLAGLLVRLGVVEEDEMAKAMKKKRGRASLSQVLSKMGLAKETEIQQAIRTFVLEEIYDLFTWEEGAFEFDEGTAATGVFDTEIVAADLSIDVNEAILEAARRVDEWERINRHLGSKKDIYILRKEREEDARASGDPMVEKVLGYLDGRRTVEAVIRDSELGSYNVCRVLAELIAQRHLRQLSMAELQKEAKSATKEGRYDDADALLDRALEIEHGNVEARRLSAEVKEKLNNREGAAQQYKLAASLLVEAGDAAKAADCLREAVRLQPQDLTARERLYHLLKEVSRGKQARQVALEAAGFCIKMGVHDRAAKLLEDAVESLGADEETEKMLVEVYVAQGRMEKAIAIYKQRAETAIEKGDYPTAVRTYEEVLKLNPADEEARQKISEINSGALERRRRRRKYMFRGVALTIIVVVAIAWQVMETMGRRALGELVPKVEQEILAGNYAGARDILLTFGSGRFGWTRAGRHTKSILRVMQMMRAYENYRQGEEYLKGGRTDLAVQKFREVCSMGCPADFQEKVEKKLSDIEKER
ncbi:MAG: DUF4388 domain-containing protein [Planctomycetes bacterium]|nr:DUF4388 domain-containing protein [Planctomycetota bacterium]